jgi:hypothetical protein
MLQPFFHKFNRAKRWVVDFDLSVEIPLDTDSTYFIAFIGRCMHSLPLCYSEVACGTHGHVLFPADF